MKHMPDTAMGFPAGRENVTDDTARRLSGIFDRPVQVGSLSVPNRVWLAPLAGVSDPPFRRICQDLGAGLTYVEMLNALAVIHANRKTFKMLERHPSEPILGVQITGKTPELVAKGIEILSRERFDTIDINMGCPVRKIVHSGCGSAFLKDPARITATVEAARAATKLPLTVKIRLGFDRPEYVVEEIVERLVAAGADAITIHGRFRSDDYSIRVDRPGVKSGVSVARRLHAALPVIGNGDVMDRGSAAAMVDEAGCDGVMLSRGALGNPWVFAEILGRRTRHPTFGEWLAVVLRHIDYHEEFYGDTEIAARTIRKHLIWYATGFPRCSKMREAFNVIPSMKAARESVQAYAAQYSPDLVRFDSSREQPLAVGMDPKYDMDRQLDRGVGAEEIE